LKNIFIYLLILSVVTVSAQEATDKNVVQFSGVVVDNDSLLPLPYTHIRVKNSSLGTVCDFYGFFSIVALKGDTVVFSNLGYHKNEFIIPDTLSGNKYSIIHAMTRDTFQLKEVRIYPWPSFEQFKQAFMTDDIPDDDLERAKKNLSAEKLMAVAQGVPIDGSTTYKYELQNRYTQLYEAGGYPSLRLLDPIAWSKFIKAWKRGDFKKKGNIYYRPK